MMTTLLVDGDSFAYIAAVTNETYIEWPNGSITHECDTKEAISSFKDIIAHHVEKYSASSMQLAMTGSTNFRKEVYAGYKAKRGKKPMGLAAVKQHAFDHMGAVIKDRLEADDIIGIWATHPKIKGPKLVLSIDKDLRTIPCRLTNGKTEPVVISKPEANYHFLTQVITGDTTDNYPGLPGAGPVAAGKILDPFVVEDPFSQSTFDARAAWAAVVEAYEKKGLTFDDALVQARMARICRYQDYDFKRKVPILWTPPS